jgi:hypothetical protein
MLGLILNNCFLLPPWKLGLAADLPAASLRQAGLRNIYRNKIAKVSAKVQGTAILLCE